MKKLKVLLATLLAVACFGSVACGNKDDLYKVVLMDGTTVAFELSKEKGELLDKLPDAPSKTGYVFDGWFVDAELKTPYEADILSSDLTLYAKYKPVTAAIAFNLAGGKLEGMEEGKEYITVSYGVEYELPVPTKVGYDFIGWTLDGEEFPSTGTFERATSVKVTANWQIKEFTVTYVNGETTLATEKVDYNKTANGWNNPSAGYNVEGIYTDSEMTVKYEDGKITEDTKLYVNIIPNAYTITINTNGGSTVSPVQVLYDSEYTLTLPERVGYNFVKFTLANGETFPVTGEYKELGNLTIIAQWEIKKYTVNYLSDDETLKSETVDHGKTATGWSAVEPGYNFIGIYTDIDYTNEFDFNNPITGDLNLYVNITPINYTITFNANGGDEITPVVVPYGEAYSLTAPEREGYDFVKFVLANGSEFPLTGEYKELRSLTVIAQWKIKEYTITYKTPSETLGTETVNHGALAPAWSDIDAGYELEGMYNNAEMTEAYLGGAVTSDLTLYVKIVAKVFNIRVNENGGTQVDTTAVFGETYSIDVPEREGHDFVKFVMGGQDFEPTGTYTWTTDITVDVVWEMQEGYHKTTISFYYNGAEINEFATIVDDGTPYNIPSAYKVEKVGYTFMGWFTDSELSIKYVDGTLINPDHVGADFKLYAKVVANDYVITVNTSGGDAVAPVSVTYGQPYAVDEPEREGYIFMGYTYNGSDFNLSGNYEIASSITITANWQIKEYTVTYKTPSETLGTETVNHGDDAPVWADIDAGYELEGTYTDAEMTVKYNGEAITSDIDLYVNIVASKYEITFNANGGEAIAPVEVTYGQPYNITAPEREGYDFIKFTLPNGMEFPLSGTYLRTEGLTLKANWEIKEYTVTYKTPTSTLGYETVEHGDDAPAWTEVAMGYEIEGIYTNVEMTVKYNGEAIVTDTNLYVNIVPCTYTITIRLAGGSIGDQHDVDPIRVAYNGSYSIEMPVRQDYSFEGFTDAEGRPFALNGTYSYTDSVVITANWKSLVADPDQDGEELFIKKSTYFKVRNNTDEEFKFVFLTGMTYNFTNYVVAVNNAGSSVEVMSNSSFKAVSPIESFTIRLTRQEATGSVSYTRSAMIVENVNTFNPGADYLGSWGGDKNASSFRSDFIDKKVDQNLSVGNVNFIPDLKITNLKSNILTLEQSNLVITVTDDGRETFDYVVQSEGAIDFGSSLIGRTVVVTIMPKYDIYGAMPIVFTLDINAGVNVYNDNELRSAYKNLGISQINILRNITATVALEDTVDGQGVYGANYYDQGSAYQRTVSSSTDKITVNGNFFEIGTNAKVDESATYGFTSSLPVIHNDYSYRDWSVAGEGSLYIPNVQNGIFAYYNKNDDGVRMHNGQFTVNDLQISGNCIGDTSHTVKYDSSNSLMTRGMSYHGIVIRGGTANINNTTIVNTNIAVFTDSEVSANKDQNGNQTHAVHLNIDGLKTNDNFQSSIYLFKLVKLNLKNSQLGKSTSACIAMEDGAFPASETQLNIEVNVENTTFNNFVSGDEAWFVGYGMNGLAAALKTKIEAIVNAQTSGYYTAIHDNKINFIFFCRSTGSTETSEWNADYNKKPYIVVNGVYDMAYNGGVNMEGDTFLLFNTNQVQDPTDMSHYNPTGAVSNPKGYIVGGIEVFPINKYN